MEISKSSASAKKVKDAATAIALGALLFAHTGMALDKNKQPKNQGNETYTAIRHEPRNSNKNGELLRKAKNSNDKHTENDNGIKKTKKSAESGGLSIHGIAQSSLSYNPAQPSSGNNRYSYLSKGVNGIPEPTLLELYITRKTPGKLNFVTDFYFLYYGSSLNKITRYGDNTYGLSGTPGWIASPEQMYFTYNTTNRLSLSGGKFLSLIGIEGPSSYQSINYNESIGLIIPLTPATVTGVRANYEFNKKLSVTAGINNGWDNVIDTNFMRSMEWQVSYSPSKSLEINTEGMFGPSSTDTKKTKLYVIDNILTWKSKSKPLKLIAEYLYEHQGIAVQSMQRGISAQGVGAWIVSEPKSFRIALRNELIMDPSGVRTGVKQKLFDSTITIGKWITPNLLLDFEYRHNWSTAQPFEVGNRTNASSREDVLGARLSFRF